MNCTGRTALFYDITLTDEAKKVCDGCERLTECLEWGIQHEEYGVWGGTDPEERKQIRIVRQIRLAPPSYTPDHPNCGTNAGYGWLRRRGRTCPKCNTAHSYYNQHKAALRVR